MSDCDCAISEPLNFNVRRRFAHLLFQIIATMTITTPMATTTIIPLSVPIVGAIFSPISSSNTYTHTQTHTYTQKHKFFYLIQLYLKNAARSFSFASETYEHTRTGFTPCLLQSLFLSVIFYLLKL